jgi:hypothetical protein
MNYENRMRGDIALFSRSVKKEGPTAGGFMLIVHLVKQLSVCATSAHKVQ